VREALLIDLADDLDGVLDQPREDLDVLVHVEGLLVFEAADHCFIVVVIEDQPQLRAFPGDLLHVEHFLAKGLLDTSWNLIRIEEGDVVCEGLGQLILKRTCHILIFLEQKNENVTQLFLDLEVRSVYNGFVAVLLGFAISLGRNMPLLHAHYPLAKWLNDAPLDDVLRQLLVEFSEQVMELRREDELSYFHGQPQVGREDQRRMRLCI